jgi:hypothetical protein
MPSHRRPILQHGSPRLTRWIGAPNTLFAQVVTDLRSMLLDRQTRLAVDARP